MFNFVIRVIFEFHASFHFLRKPFGITFMTIRVKNLIFKSSLYSICINKYLFHLLSLVLVIHFFILSFTENECSTILIPILKNLYTIKCYKNLPSLNNDIQVFILILFKADFLISQIQHRFVVLFLSFKHFTILSILFF